MKVVPAWDAFVEFAEAMIEEGNPFSGFPVFHNVTVVDGHAIVLVEKIPGNTICVDPEEDWEDVELEWAETEEDGWVREWACRNGCWTDYHDENFMRREDGTLVCIDPVYTHGY